uniref:Uncharacterized protein n=1 Tax=Arundo donax TaxID=35708 RepID=A0A0A9C2P6_ARUDO
MAVQLAPRSCQAQ